MNEPIWERLPREGDKPFAAFKLYLGLGPQRNLVKAAAACQKSVSLLSKWSVRFDWPGRIRAHSAHLGGVERRAAEAVAVAKGTDWGFRKEKHREDEWQVRDELMQASREVLKKFRDGSRGATLGDVARALDLASKLGRLASGLSTEPVVEEKREDVNVLIAMDAMLDKIYGREPAAPVIEAAALPAPAPDVEPVIPERPSVLAGFFKEGGGNGAS